MKTALTSIWLLLLTISGRTTAQPAQPIRGLKGEYFSGPNFERKVLTRIDPAVDFDWNWQLPGPGVPHEYFSVRWTGKIYAPETGTYRFSALADDGVRVWVNGRKVIDEWRKQDDSQFVGAVALTGRRSYDLRIEYFNDWKGSVISVYWALPSQQQRLGSRLIPHQVIPTNYLTPAPVGRPKPVRAVMVKKETVVKKPVSRPTGMGAKPASKPIAAVSARISSPAATTTAEPAVAAFADLKPGVAVVLQHVYFAQGDYVLLPASYAELDALGRTLRANPALTIDVAGHTDNVGDKRLNLALSENRAKVVAAYLIRQGVANGRVTAKGYGGTRPIARNDDETQRSLNRRVELIVH